MKKNKRTTYQFSKCYLRTATFCLLLICSFSIITGCAEKKVKKKLGLSMSGPDEFVIRSYPDLKIPDNFVEIPKPKTEVDTGKDASITNKESKDEKTKNN